METPEAIKRLTDETVQFRQGISPKWIEAVQLGIEALKFKQAWQKGQYFPASYLLPGETKTE